MSSLFMIAFKNIFSDCFSNILKDKKKEIKNNPTRSISIRSRRMATRSHTQFIRQSEQDLQQKYLTACNVAPLPTFFFQPGIDAEMHDDTIS